MHYFRAQTQAADKSQLSDKCDSQAHIVSNYTFMTNSTYLSQSSATSHCLLQSFSTSSVYMYSTYTYMRHILQQHGSALNPGMVHSGIIRASIAGGLRIPVMRVGLPICAGFNLLATQPAHVALAAGAPAYNVRLLI